MDEVIVHLSKAWDYWINRYAALDHPNIDETAMKKMRSLKDEEVGMMYYVNPNAIDFEAPATNLLSLYKRWAAKTKLGDAEAEKYQPAALRMPQALQRFCTSLGVARPVNEKPPARPPNCYYKDGRTKGNRRLDM